MTSTVGINLISAHIFDLLWKLQSFRKQDRGININPQEETSYTTQYEEALLKYVENEYYTKRRCLPVIDSEPVPSNNLFSFVMASRSGQSCYNPSDLSSDNEQYLMPKNVADETPGQSDHAAHFLTAARLYLNSQSELPQNWGQIQLNLHKFNSDPM